MDKLEVQKNVLKDGEPLSLDLFDWCEETKTFISEESGLVLDFSGCECAVTTGSCCEVTTGSHSVVTTGDDCTVTTGSHSIVTTGDNCRLKEPFKEVGKEECHKAKEDLF